MTKNFALVGAAGYIAPRHLKAIKDTNSNLIAAVDPHDSVGILDSFFPDTKFFTEIERFDRHLEKLRRKSESERLHFLSICSPNYLHDAHMRMALRLGADAICEKPLVIKPWNLKHLKELEEETKRKIYCIFQLRYHPDLIKLREKIQKSKSKEKRKVTLTYITSRGPWYDVSWKGDTQKSGGIILNLGIHFFDLLQWLFGEVEDNSVHLRTSSRASGILEMDNAHVEWFLSSQIEDIPSSARAKGARVFRSIQVDGEEVDISKGFDNLHTKIYEEVLAGRGMGIDETVPSLNIAQDILTAEIKSSIPKDFQYLAS